MIRLHLLGFTPDLKGLVFSGRRGGRTATYWLPADEALSAALDQLERAREERAQLRAQQGRGRGRRRSAKGAESELQQEAFLQEGADDEAGEDVHDLALPAAPARESSKLSPREIQHLLREGRSVKDVAAEAGVEQPWVERFLGPVLEERAGVVRMVRESVQSRPRLGPSGLPIGRAVERNLQDRKATAQTFEEVEEGWDARRVRGQTWRVRLRFRHRGKRYTAEWELTRDTGRVTPRNKVATELGWWPPAVPPAAGTKASGNGARVAEPKTSAGRSTDTSARPKRAPKPKAAKAKPAKAKAKAKPARRTARQQAPSKRAGTTARSAKPRKTTAGKAKRKKTTAGKAKPRKTTAGKAKPKKTTAGKAKPKKTTSRTQTTKTPRRTRTQAKPKPKAKTAGRGRGTGTRARR